MDVAIVAETVTLLLYGTKSALDVFSLAYNMYKYFICLRHGNNII